MAESCLSDACGAEVCLVFLLGQASTLPHAIGYET
jgi:hypothetical protein